MLLIYILIIFIIIFLLRIELSRIRFNRKFKNIPGPPSYPIIGSALFFNPNDISDYAKLIDKVSFATKTKLSVFKQNVLVIREPSAVQKILSHHAFFEKPWQFTFFNLPYGLFSAFYPVWKPIRKVTNPAMSQSAVKNMLPVFNKHIDRLCVKIGQHVGRGSFDIENYFVKFGIEQIFETMVGHQFECSEKMKFAFQDALTAMIERLLNVFLYNDTLYKMSNKQKRIDETLKLLGDLFVPVIEERQKIYEDGNKNLLIDELISKHKEDKANWPIELLKENFISILLAGFETTAITIAHAVLMLAMHPSVDKKLFNEISTFYTPGHELNYDDIKKMDYLDMVVKEVLRLFPAVPGIPRTSMADVNIENIGNIPKDTTIIVPTYTMHRDPEIWGPEADKFDPDNFLPSKIANRHPFAYLPFSAGSRNCIGMHYANINIRFGLAKILSQYRFTTNIKFEDLKFKLAVVLVLNGEYSVEIHKR